MSQGLYTAISGIRAGQSKVDVISDNIANMNTVGFKSSIVTFENMLSRTMSKGSPPTTNTGGINPMQVGLGVGIGEISKNFGSGTVQPTGRPTDLNLQGSGFFTMSNPEGGVYLTRAGNFSVDTNGNLINPKGYKVLGTSTSTGVTSSTPIKIPQTLNIASSKNSTTGAISNVQINTGDASNVNPATAPWNTAGTEMLQNGKATLVSVSIKTDGSIEATYADSSKKTCSFTVTGNPTKELKFKSPEGTETKTSDGLLTVQNAALAPEELQMQLALIPNPKGLISEGGNLYSVGPNSGKPLYSTGDTSGLGAVQSGGLESSNVDLTSEFAEMMVAQRCVEANSKTFQAQDTVMRTIVNLAR